MHYSYSDNRLIGLVVPASGDANEGSMQNVGQNGNLWSSSLNSSDVQNAWNFNFNANNGNVNNDNRYNGLPVRGVLAQISFVNLFYFYIMYKLSKEQLLFDLYVAFEYARKHKNNKKYVQTYEENLYDNLTELRDVLFNRTYTPESSVCFIVEYPKKREIFAANFRDRIVHHLYFNYMHKLFENTFIHDTYSCIKGRGTHFGIKRCRKHIIAESKNYTKECYALKMDIKGYFIHIDRTLLVDLVNNAIDKMTQHKISKGSNKKWCDVIDIEFVKYLTNVIATLDPTLNCKFRSPKSAWIGLPSSKSLFSIKNGCGLPIGNLTSQLFSNVYLNELDQYAKRVLHCKHYGRYVDDFFVISQDKEFLKSIIPKIEKFLLDKLHLEIHKGKTKIINVKYGVEFLGAFIKPNRTYIANESLRRIKRKIFDMDYSSVKINNPIQTINSYLGIFSHYKSLNIRKQIFDNIISIKRYGYFNENYTKFIPYNK